MGTTELSDRVSELLPRCRSGDEEAFLEIYRALGDSLYGTALRILRRPEDAEEAVQETFTRFWQKAPALEAVNLTAWLRRVAVNCCLDRLRRASHRKSEELPDDMPGQPLNASHETRMDLARAVSKLPRRARLVFLLHDVEGFRHRDVATALGITEGTSKAQLFRAREALRRLLEPAMEALS
jgi:RNA polymerase sigma-70 factor (ECF subfamily)